MMDDVSFNSLQFTFTCHQFVKDGIHFLLLVPSLHFPEYRHDFVAREAHRRKFANYDIQRNIFVLHLRRRGRRRRWIRIWERLGT